MLRRRYRLQEKQRLIIASEAEWKRDKRKATDYYRGEVERAKEEKRREVIKTRKKYDELIANKEQELKWHLSKTYEDWVQGNIESHGDDYELVFK